MANCRGTKSGRKGPRDALPADPTGDFPEIGAGERSAAALIAVSPGAAKRDSQTGHADQAAQVLSAAGPIGPVDDRTWAAARELDSAHREPGLAHQELAHRVAALEMMVAGRGRRMSVVAVRLALPQFFLRLPARACNSRTTSANSLTSLMPMFVPDSTRFLRPSRSRNWSSCGGAGPAAFPPAAPDERVDHAKSGQGPTVHRVAREAALKDARLVTQTPHPENVLTVRSARNSTLDVYSTVRQACTRPGVSAQGALGGGETLSTCEMISIERRPTGVGPRSTHPAPDCRAQKFSCMPPACHLNDAG
jgi:hypothetical protein